MMKLWRWLYRHCADVYETYETDQKWMVNSFFVSDWLTRVLGATAVRQECCICGDVSFIQLSMKRWGGSPTVGLHPLRVSNKQKHLHPELSSSPMLWARPLRNPAALRGR